MKKGSTSKIKKINKEGLFCIIVAILVLVLLIFTMNNFIFISALLISFSLELFSVCYYLRKDDKKVLTYTLFMLGVGFIIIAIIYMIVNSI